MPLKEPISKAGKKKAGGSDGLSHTTLTPLEEKMGKDPVLSQRDSNSTTSRWKKAYQQLPP